MTRHLIQRVRRAAVACVFSTGVVLASWPGVAQAAAGTQQPPVAAPPAQGSPAVPPATPPPAAGQTPAPPAVTAAPPAAPQVPGTVTCPVPVPPATVPARSFTAPAGMIFHQVIPARIADFDRFLAYLRDALAKTTNPTVQQQARGWSFHRAVEAGPNGDALYIFMFDPAVPCVDYALGPIVTEAYPDPAQALEIWKLYQNSVRGAGSFLLTLVPAPVVPLTPPLTPPTNATPASTAPGPQKPTTAPSAPAPQAPPPLSPPATKTPGD